MIWQWEYIKNKLKSSLIIHILIEVTQKVLGKTGFRALNLIIKFI